VVWIVVDTLRADHLGLYGYARPTSTSLERWGRRGVVFDRSFSTAPWTLPSFASLFTGQLPSRHGAGTRVPEGGAPGGRKAAARMRLPGEKTSFAGLDADSTTLAEILAEHGFATAAIVDNPFLLPVFGVARGFEHYDHESGDDLHSRRADTMVDLALAWLDARDARPFFLLLHLFDPHMAYDAPPPARLRFARPYTTRLSLPVSDALGLREHADELDESDRDFVKAAYDEEVLFTDMQIGRFLDALEARGELERALVVLTADHGEELFDHDSIGHGHTLYDEQLRVPLVFWAPEARPRRVATPVSGVDVAPTVLDALGLDLPAEMQGVSLWPAIRGVGEVPDRVLFAERTGTGSERKAAIHWPFKLVLDTADGTARVFELEEDPGETRDRAAQEPEQRAALVAAIRDALREEGAPEPVPLDAKTRDELRDLGYLDQRRCPVHA
jgi:arylsulfatase A-like enzyme